MKFASRFIFALLMMLGIAQQVRADEGRMEPAPKELQNITVVEHLGAQLPLDLAFVDEHGKDVKLGDYFGGKKPIVLQLGYYRCPHLCGYMSKGILDAVKAVSLDAGKDYDLLFVSIDPNETSGLAAEKKRSFLEEYDRPDAGAGWHFVTGRQRDISVLAQATGFKYNWVPSVQQYYHPAVLFICTPEGKIARCLYGVKFDPQTVKYSLIEASGGKIGTTLDHFILTCSHYDGSQGKYASAAMGLMRMGGVLTMVILAIVLTWLFRREIRQRRMHVLIGHV